MTFEIRLARLDDAQSFSKMAAESFRETFLPSNEASDIEDYIAKNYTTALQAADIQDPHKEIWLALHGKSVVGYVQLKDGPPEACVRGPKPYELQRIYVASTYHGQGLAQRLMEKAIQRAQAKGFVTLWLGVWERNERALKFYRKFGFEVVGDHVFVLGNDPQRDLILAKNLST